MTQTVNTSPARIVREVRWYNNEREGSIYQATFLTRFNDTGSWDTIELTDPDHGITIESNRQWLDTYYPEIHQDIEIDPVEGWEW